MDKFQSKYFNTAILMDEALLLLLEKKDYQYITVKEICQKAGVNRSTFYLHYETMDDLLKEAIAMINKRFYESFGSKKDAFKGDWKMSKNKSELVLITPDYLKPYLEFIKENKKVFKLIHNRPELFDSESTFEKMYQELFEPIMDKLNVPRDEQKYVLTFYSKGILAVIMLWLADDCKEPIDKIMNIIMKYTPTGNVK